MAAPSGSYNLSRSRVSTTTAITVIQVAVPANCAIEPTRAQGGQSSSTTSTAGECSVVRKTANATVTSATPGLMSSESSQASKCVGGTAATGITATVEGTDGNVYTNEPYNIVGNGFLWLPVPEERPMIGPSEFIAIKHFVAPTGTWSHQMNWLEWAF